MPPVSSQEEGGPSAPPAWPPGWSYLQLPLLTFQRLDDVTIVVQWHDADPPPSVPCVDRSIEVGVTEASITFERVSSLLRDVLSRPGHERGVRVMLDTSEMTYDFAINHLASWISSMAEVRPGWQRIVHCDLVLNSGVMQTLVKMAVNDSERLKLHDSLEDACLACNIDPELLVL